MARISDLDRYNNNRYEAIKIKTANDETVLMTADDLKAVMVEYLSEELNFFADGITKKDKIKIQERVNFKLTQIENGMIRHIDDKINKITENIVSLMTTRMIEEEVAKRVELRIQNIKNLL
jgi:hypothetical protein